MNASRIILSISLAVLLGLFPGARLAVGENREPQLSPADQSFLQNAAQDVLLPSALAELAQDQSNNPDIKEFASLLQAECAKATELLRPIAGQNVVALSTDLNVAQSEVQSRLAQLSGAAFDQAFLAEIIPLLKSSLGTFVAAARNDTGAEDVRSAAGTIAAAIEIQLNTAQGLETKRYAVTPQ